MFEDAGSGGEHTVFMFRFEGEEEEYDCDSSGGGGSGLAKPPTEKSRGDGVVPWQSGGNSWGGFGMMNRIEWRKVKKGVEDEDNGGEEFVLVVDFDVAGVVGGDELVGDGVGQRGGERVGWWTSGLLFVGLRLEARLSNRFILLCRFYKRNGSIVVQPVCMPV
ncbi:unnamed protein product [Linum trigynum]|uniref:Uncharacterized protein n=1 Tax=Linum trigynum TaxID=586398 RepID=A0AAV2EQY2_9ROSI